MRSHRPSPALALLIGLLAAGGCTHKWEAEVEPYTQYPATEKIDMAVALQIDEAYKAAQLEVHAMGDTWLTPLGQGLSDNSRLMCEHLFREVQVVEAESVDASAHGVDAVVTPSAVGINQNMPIWAFDEMELVVEVEWAVRNRANQVIFQDTIKGSGANNAGNAFTSKSQLKKRVQLMMDDLFSKSFTELSASPEIRQAAKTD